MKIVLLPKWLEAPLASANVGLDAILSLSKLSTILSMEDVAFYYHLQLEMDKLLPVPVVQTFDKYFSLFGEDLNEQEIGLIKESNRINEYAALTYPEDSRMLLIGERAAYDPALENQRLVFNPEPLSADTLVIKVALVDPVTQGSQAQVYCDLYSRLINLLLLEQPFERIAETTLFVEYLKESRRR